MTEGSLGARASLRNGVWRALRHLPQPRLQVQTIRAKRQPYNTILAIMYSWDDKKAECYRLYVEENKNLDEVISYWEVRGFTPRLVAFHLIQAVVPVLHQFSSMFAMLHLPYIYWIIY